MSRPEPRTPFPLDEARVVANEPWVYAGLAAVGLAFFAIRLAGPPNLLDNEYRVGACVLDVLQHGNWLVPHDILGNTDKPPMLTWLAALASWPTGRVDRFTIYLPTALATIATAWLVAGAGRRRFGGWAGALGALAYLCSHVGVEQMGTARWDGLFAFTVTLAALAAFDAWETGSGWMRFWLAAAAATLTKGPLGVVLAGFGLLAVPWERRGGHAGARLTGSQAPGLALYLLITVGWFVLAYHRVGPHLVDNMVRDEFFGTMVEHAPGTRFWKPLGDLLANFAPWSVFAVMGLVRTVRRPAADDEPRRFERFLWCWFVGGLVIFSVSPHNQARLMDPMVPAAALLVGRELDRLAGAVSPRRLAGIATATVVVALPTFALVFQRMESQKSEVRQTMALQRMAATIESTVGRDFPLAYTADTPYAIQLALNTMRPPVSIAEAAALLRGPTAAYVVVRDIRVLERTVGTDVHELLHEDVPGAPMPYLVANRPALAWDGPAATRVGPFVVTTRELGLAAAWDGRIALASRGVPGDGVVENASPAPQPLRLDVAGVDRGSRVLAPGETWRVDAP